MENINDLENKKRLHVRFTPKEFEKINSRFAKTTCRKISEYSRNILLGKPVTFYTRNQSLDEFMLEMIRLRKELNHIGHNFNQAVKKTSHAWMPVLWFRRWVLFQESRQKQLIDKVGTIQEKIH